MCSTAHAHQGQLSLLSLRNQLMSSSQCNWVMEVTWHCGEVWFTAHDIGQLRTYVTEIDEQRRISGRLREWKQTLARLFTMRQLAAAATGCTHVLWVTWLVSDERCTVCVCVCACVCTALRTSSEVLLAELFALILSDSTSDDAAAATVCRQSLAAVRQSAIVSNCCSMLAKWKSVDCSHALAKSAHKSTVLHNCTHLYVIPDKIANVHQFKQKLQGRHSDE